MAGIATGSAKDRVDINLYPLLDVFSILICFLLMSFSSQPPSDVSELKGLELPVSSLRVSIDDAPQVSISTSYILIGTATEGKPISIPMVGQKVAPDEIVDGMKGIKQWGLKRAYEYFKALKAKRESLKNQNASIGKLQKDSDSLYLMADKNTQFEILKRVMISAQQAEFVSWKLAVQKDSID